MKYRGLVRSPILKAKLYLRTQVHFPPFFLIFAESFIYIYHLAFCFKTRFVQRRLYKGGRVKTIACYNLNPFIHRFIVVDDSRYPDYTVVSMLFCMRLVPGSKSFGDLTGTAYHPYFHFTVEL